VIGRTISHYKIVEELGRGGMGVVYKAVDTRLDRPVVLKFLTPTFTSDTAAKKRFILEAKAASALQHNNICTIHGIDETDDGRMFICMEYYEGQTLKQMISGGPLPADRVADITHQVAEGLAKAHRAGMVHRDIKPANIVVTRDGVVKILDFGVAKLAGQTKLTRTGATVGTVSYMSPEQARGEDTTAGSDVFSLGCVMYEMLTGKNPFAAEHDAAALYRIMNIEPEPVQKSRDDVPAELQRVVDTALQKGVPDRYQNAAELAADLDGSGNGGRNPGNPRRTKAHRRWRMVSIASVSLLLLVTGYFAFTRVFSPAPGPDNKASIAVLPFVNLSSDPDNEYFSDGITEDLIHALARINDLRVLSRTSAFQFKGRALDVREIGRKLGVGTVLEGTVRIAGDQLVITANLIDVENGLEIWSDRFEKQISNVFAIQSQIATTIADKMHVHLVDGGQTQLVERHTDNIDAYTLYLRGRYQWNIRTPEALERAASLFEQSAEFDTNYALAWAGLADVYLMMANYSTFPADSLFLLAESAALRALNIDDRLAEAHASYAMINFVFRWDYDKAERAYRRAVELQPSYATAHHWYAMFLAFMGRPDEAIDEINLALSCDPVSLIINSAVGLVLYFAGDYDAAIEQCYKTLELDPEFVPAQTTLGRAYSQKGMYADAAAWLEKAIEIAGPRPNTLGLLGYVYAKSGQRARAEEILSGLQSPERRIRTEFLDMVMVYVGLGDMDNALEWVAQIRNQHSFEILLMQADPALSDLRNTTKYEQTMASIGFPLP
jgi:serine/threonine-protein kinase